MKTQSNKLFMAFANGSESVEGATFDKYIGVGVVNVLAVNPTKEKLEELYGTQLQKEPEYTGVKDGVKWARVDFIIRVNKEKHPDIDYTGKLSFFLRDEYRTNRDNTKVQVIDKYGETGWLTKEEVANKTFDRSKFARLSNEFKPCHVGEDSLVRFIKAFLVIPDSTKYVNGKWVFNDELGDSEAALDEINEYFKGNFKELNTIIAMQPNNRVKVVFGVRTSDDNKQYQAFYTNHVMRLNVTDYSRVDAEIKNSQEAGSLKGTEFSVCDLKKYEVAPTSFDTATPFAAAAQAAPQSWFNSGQ